MIRSRRRATKTLAVAVLALGGSLLTTIASVASSREPGTGVSVSATTQAIDVPGGVAYVTFHTLSPAEYPGALPASSGYVLQYASVELCPLIGGCTWHANVSGDWEYNGTYAYTYSGPDCEVTDPGPYSCIVYANGAELPHNMTWKMVGTAYTGPWSNCRNPEYSIAIYFWGNGGHNVSTSDC